MQFSGDYCRASFSLHVHRNQDNYTIDRTIFPLPFGAHPHPLTHIFSDLIYPLPTSKRDHPSSFPMVGRATPQKHKRFSFLPFPALLHCHLHAGLLADYQVRHIATEIPFKFYSSNIAPVAWRALLLFQEVFLEYPWCYNRFLLLLSSELPNIIPDYIFPAALISS